MKARKLSILIVVLYAVAAFCMLGTGSVREQLREEKADRSVVQNEAVPQAEEAGDAEAFGEKGYQQRIKELEMKLTIWQIVTLIIFATASLLLMFKEKLVNNIPPPAK